MSRRAVTIDDLDYALSVVAYAMTRHGDVYAPILERLEAELDKARREDPMERARAILRDQTLRGGRNAIRVRTSALLSSE